MMRQNAKRFPLRLRVLCALAAAAAALFAAPCVAQPEVLAPRAAPAAQPAVSATPPPRPLTREDLEAWLDGMVPYQLQRGDVAGAVVVVVKDGKVLLQKGYGYADVARRRPVDPETTLFRPGSVSKLFTWTAVMQQVEQGHIDLDRDVNAYLDFKIPPFQGRPITMRDLMTHSSGFQDSLRNLVLRYPHPIAPLDQYLRAELPPRIYPPGEITAYSNYGVALAGYIVERVSHERYDDYIEQHIFAPLGMNNATFREPVPARLSAQMAKGYNLASQPATPFEMFTIRPAGSSAISGADMARFMIAHLQDGAFDGRRILQPATARMMHDTASPAAIAPLNHPLLGFYEVSRNGRRIIGHGGDTIYFHSELQLFPEEQIGLFVSMNSIGRDGAVREIRKALLEGFADRYVPGAPADGHVPAETAKTHAALIAGQYGSSRWAPRSFLSLLDLFVQTKVTTDGKGHIFSSGSLKPNGQPVEYREIAPFVWQGVDGGERLAAKVVDGKVVRFGADEEATEVALPRPVWGSAAVLTPLIVVSSFALLLTAAAWPVGVLYRRRYGGRFALGGGAAWSHRLVRVGGAAASLVLLAWVATIFHMMKTFDVGAEIDPWIMVLHLLSILAFPVATAGAVWNAWANRASHAGLGRIVANGWNLVLVLSSLVLLWVALVFHLIGLGLVF